MESAKPIPLRITIGVTGHRKGLTDIEELSNKIITAIGLEEWRNNKIIKENTVFSFLSESAIKDLGKAHSTEVELTVLTALAEGADRIVARVLYNKYSNTRIEAILPLTVDDYKEDFNTAESKKEFEDLLELDYKPTLLRKTSLHTEFATDTTLINNKRKEAYLDAGKFIVDKSDVLLAIWDEKSQSGTGGTAQVVDYAKEKKCPILIISTADDYTVKTSSKDIHQVDFPYLSQLDCFNKFTVSEKEKCSHSNSIHDELFKTTCAPPCTSFETSFKEILSETLFPYYAKASAMSKTHKNRHAGIGLAAYILSTLAVIIVLTCITFKIFLIAGFLVEFVLLLIILISITIAHKKEFNKQWLHCRYLVERLRTMPYLFIADMSKNIVGQSISKNERLYWAVYITEEIRNNIVAHLKKAGFSAPFNIDVAKYIATSWIQGQIEYHEDYGKTNECWNKRLEIAGRIIFLIAIFSALGHILITWKFSENHSWECIEKILTIVALSLPPIAAAFEGIRRQREFSRNKGRSDNMIKVLKKLHKKYLDIKPNERKKFALLLIETDREMLRENSDWVNLMIWSELEYVT